MKILHCTIEDDLTLNALKDSKYRWLYIGKKWYDIEVPDDFNSKSQFSFYNNRLSIFHSWQLEAQALYNFDEEWRKKHRDN